MKHKTGKRRNGGKTQETIDDVNKGRH